RFFGTAPAEVGRVNQGCASGIQLGDKIFSVPFGGPLIRAACDREVGAVRGAGDVGISGAADTDPSGEGFAAIRSAEVRRVDNALAVPGNFRDESGTLSRCR